MHLRFAASSDAAFDRQDEELRQDLLKKLISRKLTGPTLEVTDSDPARLPVRELPPGNVSCLYLMYVGWTSTAQAGSSTAACKSTFYAAWKHWSSCLKFRRRSEHAMCVTCQRLKAEIHAAKESQLSYYSIFLYDITAIMADAFTCIHLHPSQGQVGG